MSESVDQTWRQKVADQIRFSRDIESSGYLVKDRDASDYVTVMHGMRHLLNYVRENSQPLGSNIVLDVGAGSTKATAQLSRSDYGLGLVFRGTVLKPDQDIENYLGQRNVRITPVETLRGIEDQSVACILSVNAMAYSAAPEQAIERVNQVLVPGGVIKATFQHKDFYNEELRMKPHDKFTSELRARGYDIAIEPNLEQQVDIVVAVKPGGKVTAKHLLQQDKTDWQIQVANLKATFLKSEVSSVLAK